MDEIEGLKRKCGEIYVLLSGKMSFHCTLCEKKYSGYEEFYWHLNIVHKQEEGIKEEDDEDAILPDETMDVSDEEKPEVLSDGETFSEGDELPLQTSFEEDQEVMDEDGTERKTRKQTREAPRKLRGKKVESRKKVATRQTQKADVNVKQKHRYPCTECDYSTDIKAKLEEHTRRHFNDRPFKCDYCEQRFIVKGEKNRHTQRQHPEHYQPKTHTEEELKHKALIQSLLINLGNNKFQCKECDYVGEGRAIFWYHVSRRHSLYKPHQCTMCPKTFYTRNDLNVHIRSHTGEKPFMCTECGKSFSTSGHLSNHLKRHKNIRDKECEICLQRFFNTTHLKNHMAVHSDERNFACDICAATFKRKKTLNVHMKTHLKDEAAAYQCEVCDAKFAQENSLKNHIKRKHTLTNTEKLVKEDHDFYDEDPLFV